MKKIITYSLFFVMCVGMAMGQEDTDQQLAFHYVKEGDCEKALPYLEKVYQNRPTDIVYKRYLSCLRKEGTDREIINLMKEQVKNHPDNVNYQVNLGKEYERQNKSNRADRIFQNLIDDMQRSPSQVISLQRAFSTIGKPELALETLKKGDELMQGTYPFHMQYADVYGELNQTEKMINTYIDLLDERPNYISSIKRVLPRIIDFEDKENKHFQVFHKSLLKKVQKNPDRAVFSDLLIWALIQQKNFTAALVQAKALDRRTDSKGRNVFKLAGQALQNKEYSTARKAYQHLLEYGEDNPYYYTAMENLLNVRFQEITIVRNATAEQIQETIEEYEAAIESLPQNGKLLPIIRELATIEAYYGEQPKSAASRLTDALKLPRYNELEEARTKMLLADIMVLQNEVWEASLLYMQIEKSFKYETIGEEAKFKNARIFYYDGDFKFAQSQLDVLKQATTRLIANDAMKLSAFITDNLGLDSNYTAMRQFANADLLLEQHQYSQAFTIYDSIEKTFPTHQLRDDILMRKSIAYQQQGEWEQAINYLEKITTDFNDDILVDDALFQLGKIYENHLFDAEKAAEYYFKLMRDHPGSLFTTEARKAYREIQGNT